VPEVSLHTDLLSTSRAVFLELPVVILYTGFTEFVEAMFDCERFFIDVKADRAIKLLFDFLEQG